MNSQLGAIAPRLHRMHLTVLVVAYMAATVHVALIVFFAAIGATFLALLNVGSSVVWSLCIRAIRRGASRIAVPLALGEVYVHASACMAVVGLDPGFQHYLWAGIPFIMFNGGWSRATMTLVAAVFAATYVLGTLLARNLAYAYAFPELVPYVHTINALVAFSALTLACLYFRSATQLSLERLRDLADTDPLTGLFNRRRMSEGLGAAIPGMSSGGGMFSIALGDIDRFKSINDRFGHECGDAVIREIADRLRMRLRRTDFVARWGGDEFLIVMPGSNAATAKATVESLCADIAGVPVRCGGHRVPVSMTFGIVEHGAGESMDAGLRRADQALYRGKEAGRNRVVVAA